MLQTLFFRIRSLLLLTVCLPTIGFSQCIAGDCQNGRGAFRFPDGSRYIGQFENGEIHGWGSLLHNSGHRYRGTWAGRLPNGKGILQLADGRTWSGIWRFGHPLDLKDEDFLRVVEGRSWPVQIGCLSGDCGEGEGVQLFPDGGKHTGRFEDGLAHGNGIRLYSNGIHLEGQFRFGVLDGEGVLSADSNLVLKGIWRNGEFQNSNASTIPCREGDCLDGEGVAVLWEGSGVYRGSFHHGLPDGHGLALFSDASFYEGEWKNGKAHGRGCMFQSDGSFFSGVWTMGSLKHPDASTLYAANNSGAQEQNQGSAGESRQGGFGKEPFRSSVMLSIENGIASTANFHPQKVWAVIVGVAEYHHMPPLRYTDDDAYRMFAFLKSPEGGALDDERIRILIDEDATKKSILGAMMDVFYQAGPQDLVMLYFSGHGLEGSFLPFDFDGMRNQLFHHEINELLNNSPAGFKLCIADACHSGSLVAVKGGQLPSEGEEENEKDFVSRTGLGNAMLLSSRSNETSLESSGLRQGVFTHYLIRGWKGEADLNSDYAVSLQELYDFLYEEVRRYTNHRQSPMITGDFPENLLISSMR